MAGETRIRHEVERVPPGILGPSGGSNWKPSGEAMSDVTVTRETTIEELVTIVPASVGYLREQGIRCIRCGEPIWGSLEEAAKEKGFGDADIDRFVRELNDLGESEA